MADQRNLPHVLIDAIPELTARLLENGAPTFIWSSSPLLSRVPTLSIIDRGVRRRGARGVSPFDEFDEYDEADETGSLQRSLVWQLDMAGLIFEALKLGKPPIEGAVARLETMVRAVHSHFDLQFDEPVRIACVGSHGSLWRHEHSNVPQRNSDIAHYLDDSAKKRQFVADLHAALKATSGIQLEWAAEACPELASDRERHWKTDLPPLYKKLAELARQHLREKPRLAPLRGCVPLVYTETGGEWQLYGDSDRGPSRTTKRLLEQYSTSRANSEGRHSVLVKLLPDESALHNPCDNPIVDTEQLELARRSGVSAVLLDARRGVIHHADVRAKPELPEIYAA